MNPLRWLDKLFFACILIGALQIPVLIDQYKQYLNGYVQALETQVNEWRNLAQQFDYPTVEAFIERLSINSDPIVREDAKLKQNTLQTLIDMRAGLATLGHASYPEKVMYVFSPSNIQTLKHVMQQFEPGIPLNVTYLVYSLALSILVNLVLMMPYWLVVQLLKRRRQILHNSEY